MKAKKLKKAAKDDSQGRTQPPVANQNIKIVRPMTFSQKFYQSHEIEIAEEFEQALENNSLEEIKKLLDKMLDLGEG